MGLWGGFSIALWWKDYPYNLFPKTSTASTPTCGLEIPDFMSFSFGAVGLAEGSFALLWIDGYHMAWN